jgi:hypothetical protein
LRLLQLDIVDDIFGFIYKKILKLGEKNKAIALDGTANRFMLVELDGSLPRNLTVNT